MASRRKPTVQQSLNRPLFLIAGSFLILIHSLCFSQIAGNWQLVGPDAFPVNITGQIHGIGRVCQIKFHPTIDSVMYAASASGGLYKSTDRGLNWNVLGTDVLPGTACASVCIDYTNDSILYLGTGDPNYYGNGLGIWKSTDGGATWFQSGNGMGNLLVVEILMDPIDPQILIAATKNGIWKSYDGGANWQVKNPGGEYTDMKFKAVTGTSVIYAVNHTEFWKSDDTGETWNQIALPLPSNGTANGIRISVTPADTNVVYAGVLFFETTTHYGTVYRSDDGGLTFTGVKTQAAPDIAGYDATSPGQGNYNWTICADPVNADNVFVGSHCVWRSNDGGVNWTKLTNWWQEVHTDMHQYVYNPYDTTELWQANDGGVWLSTNNGVNWAPRSDGIAATENYHAAQSPVRKDMISIGTQDNGELFYQSAGWFCNRGGDWTTRMAFDYSDPTRVYYFSDGERRNVNGANQSLNLPFTSTSSSRMTFTGLDNSLAFASLAGIWRTTNLNSNPPSWTQVFAISNSIKSMAVSHNRADQLYAVGSTAKVYRSDNALDPVPVFNTYSLPVGTSVIANITTVTNDTNVVYLTAGTKVYRSSDRGVTWTNITYNLPNVNLIGIVHDSSYAVESMYVASAVGVWYKNDTMSYWMNYSQGLPSIAGISELMMYNNGSVSNSLRVSYYGRGTWESELFGSTALPPDPLFTADTTYGCTGLAVQFTDLSIGNPTSWNWTFQGGAPAASSQQNPQVIYNTPGIYDVSLTVSNANGSKIFTKSGYIVILGSQALPLQEGFQSALFPTAGWKLYSATGDGAWQRNSIVGGYALSQGCAFFDNFNADLSGKRYAMRTPAYDLTNSDSALITFDVAYAQYSNFYSDTLIVSASTDCGVTWTTLYYKGGYELSTSGNVTANAFVPAGFQWRTDSIWLNSFSGQPQVQFAFENKNGYGQMLYVDNINIADNISSGFQNVNNLSTFTVFPNPTSAPFTVSFSLISPERIGLKVYDSTGKLVKTITPILFSTGSQAITVDLNGLDQGNYRLELSGAQHAVSNSVIWLTR